MSRIHQIIIERLEIPLRHSFATARDTLARQVTSPVAVTVELSDGSRFTGESVPVHYVTGETTDTVVRSISEVQDALLGRDVRRLRPLVSLVESLLPEAPTARAGLEMAILRAFCGLHEMTMWEYFGGALHSVETDITIPIVSDYLERAQVAAERGFTCFKMKVGSTDIDEDFSRLMRLHQQLPGVRFRVDANQAFDAAGALRFIERALASGVSLELVEQPTPKEDLKALDEVARHSPVPVFADESVKSPSDALRVVCDTHVQGINVKLMKAGLFGAEDIVAIARTAGVQLMIGCMLETRRGIAASLEFACGTGAFGYVDLDSHFLLSEEGENMWFEEAGPLLTPRH